MPKSLTPPVQNTQLGPTQCGIATLNSPTSTTASPMATFQVPDATTTLFHDLSKSLVLGEILISSFICKFMGENVALNKDAYVSANITGLPNLLTDGIWSTASGSMWTHENAASGAWIAVDLGKRYCIPKTKANFCCNI